MQKLALAQLTAASWLAVLLVSGELTMLQLVPFHSSITLAELLLLD